MTCFLVKLVACPGESLKLDPANLSCPNWPPTTGIGIVKRPTPCSVLVLATPFAPRFDIVKRQFIVLLDLKA